MGPTFSDTPRDIYLKVMEIIEDNPTFSYFKTKQPGFYPRDSILTSPTLYPWIFVEFGSITEEDVIRKPRVWSYEFVFNIVALTFADKFHPEDLVFSTGLNVNPGIGDIALDIRRVFGGYKGKAAFGIDSVQDWKFIRTGTPTILKLQQLLTHEFIRGIQCDMAFQIIDRL